MSRCASFTAGFLAYNNIDLVPNGFINEQDEDRNGEIVRLLPSSRINVELQYSVRSDISGTSLNDLSPGGNTGFILGGLGGGAGFGIGAALGCSLLGDFEPTLSRFIFQVIDSQTRINRIITVTEAMIAEAEENEGVASYRFFSEYPLGVLAVRREPIEFSDDEVERIGASGGAQRGWTISQNGQIQGSYDNFSYSDETNLFVEVVRDQRKQFYRADQNIFQDGGDNAFLNAGDDDLVDNVIRFELPGFVPQGDDAPADDTVPIAAGDPLYLTYTAATKRHFRHAIESRSFFFLFPGFLVERIGIDQVKAWTFKVYDFKVRKNQTDLQPENKATLDDWFADIAILQNPDLTPEQKEDRQVLETIEGQRIIECINDTKNKFPYIKGIYFADTRGILAWDVKNDFQALNVELLIPADSIRDQAWWANTVASLVDFGPGFNDEGHLDPADDGANRILRGFVFDISDHVNSVCYDNDKFGYQRGLADALAAVSRFNEEDPTSGVGVPNLDLERLRLPRRNRFDLSSAEFETVRMSSIEGGAYFVRSCNEFFTYDQQFCAAGTIQADMFIRTPIFFENFGRTGRVHIERFSPQFPLERDGGIWVTTRPTFGAGMSMDSHPTDNEAFLVFTKDQTLNFMRFKDSRTNIHTGRVSFDAANSGLTHEVQSVDTVTQSDLKIVGFDKVIGNQPGHSRGIEITREGGKLKLGLENYNDLYEVLTARGVGTINFVQNEDTGEVTVQGLQGKRLKSIKMFFRPKEGFLGEDTRYCSFIFPSERFVIDNVALPYAGGTLDDERFVKFDAGYYFDDSIRVSGEILKYAMVTGFEFIAIKEEKYEENFIETGTPAVCFDRKGRVFVFYEDNSANVGQHGDQPEGCSELVDGGQTEISCLVSPDLGNTWYDHKGIVYGVGEDTLRAPYVVSDRSSGKIHLFFVMNDNLMHKELDPNLFKIEDAYKAYRRPVTYSDTTPDLCGLGHFSSAGANLRRRDMNVVVGNIQDETGYIFEQISVDRSRKLKGLKQRITVSGDFAHFEEGFPDTDYIAYVDRKRALRVLYVSNGRLFARTSDSNGRGWESVFEEGVFFHKNLDIQEPLQIGNLGVILNDESNSLDISYITEDMLFVRSFENGGLFAGNSAPIETIVDPDSTTSQPVFVVGVLPNEIQQAIVTGDTNIVFPYVSAALPLFDETLSISPVGVRGFVGKSGVVRMFYQDSNGEIRGFSYTKKRPLLDAKAVANGE